MAGRLVPLLLALVATSGALAQALTDPTRPASVRNESGASGQDIAQETGLTAILRRGGCRAAAIINGELVELGGVVSGSRLLRIGEDSVVLKSPTGKETVLITPGIAKQSAQPMQRSGPVCGIVAK